jgi:ketosteroid isomerase-like protein
MVEQPTQFVRRAYDAWNWYGVDHLEPFLADDVVLYDWEELADAGVWRGREAVVARLEDVGSRVGGGWVELHDVREVEDGVRVEMEWKLDSGADEAGVSLGDLCHVVGLEGEKIASIRVVLRHEE